MKCGRCCAASAVIWAVLNEGICTLVSAPGAAPRGTSAGHETGQPGLVGLAQLFQRDVEQACGREGVATRGLGPGAQACLELLDHGVVPNLCGVCDPSPHMVDIIAAWP